jgi:hypothetical protein
MNDDIHARLDGNGPGDLTSAGAQEEVEAWERLLDAFRDELPAVPPPPWLETRVMAEIESMPEPGFLSRVVGWMLAPRPIRVSPLLVGATATGGVLAAALVTVLLLGRGPAPAGGGPGVDPVVYVEFALDAPEARSVAVAGDFDGWEGSYILNDVDGDGIWTGRVPLEPGVHAYMFLIDGTEWMTDPRAQRYSDDGFGNRNAVLAVAAPSA